ncbi:MAG: 2-hydroxymuconic semialdehyde dehydrogenase [Pseudomonadota bacterium]
MTRYEHFINGRYRPGAAGRTFDNISPVDGGLIGKVCEADRSDVDLAVASARAALDGPWAQLDTAARAELLRRIADEIESRADLFLEAECADTGKPSREAEALDVARGAGNFRAFANMLYPHGDEAFAQSGAHGELLNVGQRVPKGVIAVISPWNLPLLLTTFKVAPALACGNTVVVKPSEETPATATLLGDIMNACGVPPGVFNVVNGFGPDSAGEFLVSHPGVDAITFTGETRTGEVIMRAAATGLRNVSMECGGKNPGIVFADADLNRAVEGTLRSCFSNTGQVCLGTERLYVERPIFDEFVARLVDATKTLRPGRSFDPDANWGPLISKEHRRKVLDYCALAIEEGATVQTGGCALDMVDDLAYGAWMAPTIWTGLPDGARVLREEIFGPCCHVRPFDNEAEALALANDTDYGLATTVWTENHNRALCVSHALNAGLVWVNSWYVRDLRTAFGGMGQSGLGREGGRHGLDFYTEHKNICFAYGGR